MEHRAAGEHGIARRAHAEHVKGGGAAWAVLGWKECRREGPKALARRPCHHRSEVDLRCRQTHIPTPTTAPTARANQGCSAATMATPAAALGRQAAALAPARVVQPRRSQQRRAAAVRVHAAAAAAAEAPSKVRLWCCGCLAAAGMHLSDRMLSCTSVKLDAGSVGACPPQHPPLAAAASPARRSRPPTACQSSPPSCCPPRPWSASPRSTACLCCPRRCPTCSAFAVRRSSSSTAGRP